MNWVERNERNRNIVARYIDGYTMQQIADMFQLSRGAVHNVLRQAVRQDLVVMRPAGRRKGSGRRPGVATLAVKMREQGHTYQVIGDEIGVTRQRAHQIVTRAWQEARRG